MKRRQRSVVGLVQLSPSVPAFEQQQLSALGGHNKGRRLTIRDRQTKSQAHRKVKITLAKRVDL